MELLGRSNTNLGIGLNPRAVWSLDGAVSIMAGPSVSLAWDILVHLGPVGDGGRTAGLPVRLYSYVVGSPRHLVPGTPTTASSVTTAHG